ncbi:glycerol kinase GlpK [Sphaerochaeta globosa]|uniref:Glycerol kinase n=1 Tax=Sphaerochaeta globosa (strain ATCC BAA-1886 / DSM 22777 / Buddy) TaxID=158189 RepID=F0RSJ9_SPHGB|nr:glycerol kinase GlpK [Sphaerochaeta globosa]ADY14113.1 Glycerol kinase [Sphaerochaeta globosa str. Buddy]
MKYVGALDQGTTSTRFIVFDQKGTLVASHQLEHQQIYPQPGWVEHDPWEIWDNSSECISKALKAANLKGSDIAGIGITNQRETIIAWNPKTGKVWHNAIVWQDLRGSDLIEKLKEHVDASFLQKKSGLLFSPYFSASKIAWLLDHVDGLRDEAEKGDVVFGTIDTWLTWNLTGGKALVTDVTNASRYLLMNIETCQWDDELLSLFNIPKKALPMIVPSSGMVYATTTPSGPLRSEVPVCGILGDQQAALFGQACFTEGLGKSTYGTGCFLLVNTGLKLVTSAQGLLTTVAYQLGSEKPMYALEGSIAVAGSLVQWARDNLKIVQNPQELDKLASSVPDCGGVYIVPAFSGLFAPYWRSDARGVIAGLTGYVTRAHLARAILEATAFQAHDIFKGMEKDSGIEMTTLKVDGGLTNSQPLMEFQADLLGIPVIRPLVVETTALGAAYAAGLSVGVWKDLQELAAYWKEERRWEPKMSKEVRCEKIRFWKKAVNRTLDWVGPQEDEQ